MASLQFLLLLCITVTVSAEGNLQKRIVGGRNCTNSERLYHVRVISTNGTHYSSCGGSLIHDSWVLTAAHCWEKSWTMYAIVGVHPGTNREVLKIEERDIFPYINGTTKKKNDIMLLKLPKKITGITPISLPDCTDEPQINNVTGVAGHGNCQIDPVTYYEVDSSPPRLKCVEMKVVDCRPYLPKIQRCLPNEPEENWLCGNRIGNQPEEDCKGDSGGGVVYKDKIYAVVSNGPRCHDARVYSAFLRVCPYMEWIQENLILP